eukprot:8697709-Alexandrium_andersonii.AAC.1
MTFGVKLQRAQRVLSRRPCAIQERQMPTTNGQIPGLRRNRSRAAPTAADGNSLAARISPSPIG